MSEAILGQRAPRCGSGSLAIANSNWPKAVGGLSCSELRNSHLNGLDVEKGSNHTVQSMRPGCAQQSGKAVLLGPSMDETDQAQLGEQLLDECPSVFVELCHAFTIKARLMRMSSSREVGVFTDQPIVSMCPTVPVLLRYLAGKR